MAAITPPTPQEWFTLINTVGNLGPDFAADILNNRDTTMGPESTARMRGQIANGTLHDDRTSPYGGISEARQQEIGQWLQNEINVGNINRADRLMDTGIVAPRAEVLEKIAAAYSNQFTSDAVENLQKQGAGEIVQTAKSLGVEPVELFNARGYLQRELNSGNLDPNKTFAEISGTQPEMMASAAVAEPAPAPQAEAAEPQAEESRRGKFRERAGNLFKKFAPVAVGTAAAAAGLPRQASSAAQEAIRESARRREEPQPPTQEAPEAVQETAPAAPAPVASEVTQGTPVPMSTPADVQDLAPVTLANTSEPMRAPEAAPAPAAVETKVAHHKPKPARDPKATAPAPVATQVEHHAAAPAPTKIAEAQSTEPKAKEGAAGKGYTDPGALTSERFVQAVQDGGKLNFTDAKGNYRTVVLDGISDGAMSQRDARIFTQLGGEIRGDISPEAAAIIDRMSAAVDAGRGERKDAVRDMNSILAGNDVQAAISTLKAAGGASLAHAESAGVPVVSGTGRGTNERSA